jgi:hypothetical protein
MSSPRQESSKAAEQAARFIIEQCKKLVGARHLQGRRRPPLHSVAESPALQLIAGTRIARLPEAAARALVMWGAGFPVKSLEIVPEPELVLSLQASGRRCVSLLRHGTSDPRHPGPFEFAVHDLVHLWNFAAPPHYTEQVGFFSALQQALEAPQWRRLEATLDDVWRADRAHVLADMNGSAIFLFAVLKMKLKMAARRSAARGAGAVPPHRGALTPRELEVFEGLLETLLDAAGLFGLERDAAFRTSARRDDPNQAALLSGWFDARGRARLSSAAYQRWQRLTVAAKLLAR